MLAAQCPEPIVAPVGTAECLRVSARSPRCLGQQARPSDRLVLDQPVHPFSGILSTDSSGHPRFPGEPSHGLVAVSDSGRPAAPRHWLLFDVQF